MQSVTYYFKRPRKLANALLINFFQWLPDKVFIKLLYRILMRKKLNLNNPISFQEKLQWLKIYDKNPDYHKMVDKVLVKDYVSSIIGCEYVIPLLGVWSKPEDINWDMLPNRFVLKTNHSGGNTGVIICRDKNSFNRESAIRKLNFSLKDDVYRNSREWPYKDIEKKVFAEEFIDTKSNEIDLPDYKWYCFNGEPKYCQVIKDRTTNETIDFFDTDWKHQEFVGLNPAAGPAAGPAAEEPAKPSNLIEQIKIAKELSKGIPFSRIDLYSVGDKIYFGEVTFYPLSGMGEFNPRCYNEILGNMLILPKRL